MGHEGKGIELPALLSHPWDPAHLLIREMIEEGSCDAIIAIGQLTNVALALSQVTVGQSSRLSVYAMASSFRGYGQECAEREHNSACDLPALKMVLDSPAQVKLVGLNVTRRTRMTLSEVRRLKSFGTPLALDLASMHELWLDRIGREESPMHDPLTLVAAFRPDLVRFEPMRAEVLPDSDSVAFFDDGEPNCEVAVDVDAEGFQRLFLDRIFAALR